jgi:hypothetical protein
LSKSYEEEFTKQPYKTTDKPMLRRKQRWSFITDNKNSPFYRFRIDLTIVNDDIYEVEIELKDTDFLNYNTIKPILDKINELRQGCFVSVIDSFNSLLGVTMHGKIYDTDVKPLNIKLDTLLNDITNLSITDKADGFRKFLFIHENNGYLLYPPYSIQRFVVNFLPNNSIFDGEYIENYGYLIFDLLVLNSKDVRELPFTKRLELLKELQFGESISLKEFKMPVSLKEFYEATNDILNSIKSKGYNNDGLIFNDVRDVYNSNARMYKWKPVELLTIDFKLLEKDELEFYLGVIDDNTNRIIPFKNFTIEKSELLKFIAEHNISLKSIEVNKIIECNYTTQWNMVKARSDRTNPNRNKVAESIYRDIINPITENTIRGKGLQLMRRLTNVIKEDMLKDSETVLLDIGSGRGGDISKWLKFNKTVYAVEPYLNEMKNRLESWSVSDDSDDSDNTYTKENSKIHILNTGGEDSKAIEKLTVETVVIFNALTFFFKTENLLDSLIHTIDVSKADSLIGIVMDGANIVEDMNYDSWSIKIGDIKNKVFGRDIVIDIDSDRDSIVKNQTEYLVNFNVFVKKLNAIGFELVETKLLDYPDKLPEESNALSRLYRNFVFRRIGKKAVYSKPVSINDTIFETVPEKANVDDSFNLLDALLEMGLEFKDKTTSEELLKYIVKQFKKRWDTVQYRKLRERYGDFKNAKESLKKQKNWKPLRLLLEVSDILEISIKIDDVQYGDYDTVYRLHSDGLKYRIAS